MDTPTAQTLIGNGLTQSPLSVAMVDAELRIVWANDAAEGAIADGPAMRWRGRRLSEVLPGMDVGLIERSLRRVLATGEPVLDLQVSSSASGDPGGERFWSCIQLPVKKALRGTSPGSSI